MNILSGKLYVNVCFNDFSLSTTLLFSAQGSFQPLTHLSSGLASKMFPEVLGVYRLSHTTMDSHHLFGDESNWLVKIERHNGVIEYVENPNLILVSMENRMEHGIRTGDAVKYEFYEVSLLDCKFGGWQEGPCSLSCCRGVKVLTREILREARGHGVCAGDTELVSPCASQPCDW